MSTSTTSSPSSSTTIAMQGYMMKRKSSESKLKKILTSKYVTRYFVLHTDGRLIYHREGPPSISKQILEKGGPGGTMLCVNVNECEIERVTASELNAAGGDKSKEVVANSFYLTVPYQGKTLLVTNGPEEYKQWIWAFRNVMTGSNKERKVPRGMSVPNIQLGERESLGKAAAPMQEIVIKEEEGSSDDEENEGEGSEVKKLQAQLAEEELSRVTQDAADILVGSAAAKQKHQGGLEDVIEEEEGERERITEESRETMDASNILVGAAAAKKGKNAESENQKQQEQLDVLGNMIAAEQERRQSEVKKKQTQSAEQEAAAKAKEFYEASLFLAKKKVAQDRVEADRNMSEKTTDAIVANAAEAAESDVKGTADAAARGKMVGQEKAKDPPATQVDEKMQQQKADNSSGKTNDELKREELKTIMKDKTLNQKEKQRRMEEVKQKYNAMKTAVPTAEATVAQPSSKNDNRPETFISPPTESVKALAVGEMPPTPRTSLVGDGAKQQLVDSEAGDATQMDKKKMDQLKREELKAIMKDKTLNQKEKQRRMDEVKQKYNAKATKEQTFIAPVTQSVKALALTEMPPTPRSSVTIAADGIEEQAKEEVVEENKQRSSIAELERTGQQKLLERMTSTETTEEERISLAEMIFERKLSEEERSSIAALTRTGQQKVDLHRLGNLIAAHHEKNKKEEGADNNAAAGGVDADVENAAGVSEKEEQKKQKQSEEEAQTAAAAAKAREFYEAALFLGKKKVAQDREEQDRHMSEKTSEALAANAAAAAAAESNVDAGAEKKSEELQDSGKPTPTKVAFAEAKKESEKEVENLSGILNGTIEPEATTSGDGQLHCIKSNEEAEENEKDKSTSAVDVMEKGGAKTTKKKKSVTIKDPTEPERTSYAKAKENQATVEHLIDEFMKMSADEIGMIVKVFASGSTYDELEKSLDFGNLAQKVLFGIFVTSLEEMLSSTASSSKNESLSDLVAFSLEYEGSNANSEDVVKLRSHLEEIGTFYEKQHSFFAKQMIHPLLYTSSKDAKSQILEGLGTPDPPKIDVEDENEEVKIENDGKPATPKASSGIRMTEYQKAEKTAYYHEKEVLPADKVPTGTDILNTIRKAMGFPYNWVLFEPHQTDLIVADAGSGGVPEITRLLQETYNDRLLFGLVRISFSSEEFGRRQFWAGLEWKGENCSASVKKMRQYRECLDPMTQMIGDRSFTVSNVAASEMTPDMFVDRVRRSCNVNDFKVTVATMNNAHVEEQKALKQYLKKLDDDRLEKERLTREAAEKEVQRKKEEEERMLKEKREKMESLRKYRESMWMKMSATEILEDLGKDSAPGWVLLEF